MVKRQTTGLNLSADEAFIGLVDHGLFSEKLPPCFVSKGLSSRVPKDLLSLTTENNRNKLDNLRRKHDFIRYESLRDVNIPRQMGIPHPASYIVQCLALKRHWEKIKKHCAKPETPVSRVFVRKTSDMVVFRMNYEGGGKERSATEEAKIHKMTGAHYVARTDISNCFPSIYTHSIPWALHGRKKSKENRSVLLEGNLLDRVTQDTRDGQTNGLLIGPHASNVIAEIILTRIDYKMVQEGYKRFSRHIDDYSFYAKTHHEAERFIRDLGMQLRKYELVLNERKTEILPMPVPLKEDWVRELESFRLPAKGAIVRFATVRSLLDLALNLAHGAKTSAVLNYAIKMVPKHLDSRAKRLFVQYAINLALLYPYLAPLLDKHVFDKHYHDGIQKVILEFIENLLDIGIQRIYSDSIAHALYYALKHDLQFNMSEGKLREKVIKIDDCLSDVLLLEYAERHRIQSIQDAIRERADELKGSKTREKDRFWLLIYQLWCKDTLKAENQPFLAELKERCFDFVSFK